MKRFLATVVFLCITISCFSQQLNNYKYVVIPYKFDFLDSHDQYRVNTLMRFLFKQEGFEVLYDTETLPADLVDDKCLALYADVNNDSNIFITRMTILLRDCSNKIILETAEAKTKIKAYERAYNVALRSAFDDIKAENYEYNPVKRTEKVVQNSNSNREKLNEEDVPENVDIRVEKKPMTNKKTVVQSDTAKVVTETADMLLYAQPIENGYQLVDSTPKVVMILLKTGVPNVYIVKGQDATVYLEKGVWMFSKASSKGNKVSALNIKF